MVGATLSNEVGYQLSQCSLFGWLVVHQKTIVGRHGDGQQLVALHQSLHRLFLLVGRG